MKDSIQNTIRNVRILDYVVRTDKRFKNFLEIYKLDIKKETRLRKYHIYERHIYYEQDDNEISKKDTSNTEKIIKDRIISKTKQM